MIADRKAFISANPLENILNMRAIEAVYIGGKKMN